ncbi:uncharacterized protein F4822DRAFT_414103 [Hypoxylon trugodes]|uniref:uncharacterized protein n=1 Tax=Hypoxylon trugodes TaxID=326681 RepID=UPI00219E1ECA|nr:uncharacterized protein F4822DRAFT_414103 [Hypoxylon trugodes]KAI1385764.1 hypothetical protein F4822DRAFT_414103 [Hypoxylon trugodes]
MWINFQADAPFMIKLYAGGVNVISEEHYAEDADTKRRRLEILKEKKSLQDYVVVPGQRWLDGIATSPGVVRQFVAMPKGQGYGVEAQLTGKDVVGGLQLEITPTIPPDLPKLEDDFFVMVDCRYFGNPRYIRIHCSQRTLVSTFKVILSGQTGYPVEEQNLIGRDLQFNNRNTLSDYNVRKGEILHLLNRVFGGGATEPAAGGKITQYIHEDRVKTLYWLKEKTITIFLQMLDSVDFRRATGLDPPPCPIEAHHYAAANLPFFTIDEEPSTIAGKFDGLKSINEIDQSRGIAKGPEEAINPRIIPLHQREERITIPNRHVLSIRDPDAIMDPDGPLRPSRTVVDIEQEIRDLKP